MQLNKQFLMKLQRADKIYFGKRPSYSMNLLEEDYDLDYIEKQRKYKYMLKEEINYDRSYDNINRVDNVYNAVFGRMLENSDITFHFYGNKFRVYSITNDFDIRGEYEDYERKINRSEKNNFLDIFFTLKEYQKSLLKREGL